MRRKLFGMTSILLIFSAALTTMPLAEASVTIKNINYPESVQLGDTITITWELEGEEKYSNWHTNIHIFSPLTNVTFITENTALSLYAWAHYPDDFTPEIDDLQDIYSASFEASITGTWYFRVHVAEEPFGVAYTVAMSDVFAIFVEGPEFSIKNIEYSSIATKGNTIDIAWKINGLSKFKDWPFILPDDPAIGLFRSRMKEAHTDVHYFEPGTDITKKSDSDWLFDPDRSTYPISEAYIDKVYVSSLELDREGEYFFRIHVSQYGYNFLSAIFKISVLTGAPTYTVQLRSRTTDGKTNVGTIAIDNIPYDLPHDLLKLALSYSVKAIPPEGYLFDHWETAGSLSLSNTTSEFTTFTLYGDGTLLAVFKPAVITYVLQVKSSPISGILISYTGDFVGVGATDFSIGPKTSKFTVILRAPLIYAGYNFDHWQLDGKNVGYNTLLPVRVDDINRQRIAVAVYSKEIAYNHALVATTRIIPGTIAGLAFDILGSAIIGPKGLNLPSLGLRGFGAFAIASIVGSAASTLTDWLLKDTIKDYDQRFIVSSSVGIGVSMLTAIMIGAAFPPLSLGYLAGVAITTGLSTIASYFLGKPG